MLKFLYVHLSFEQKIVQKKLPLYGAEINTEQILKKYLTRFL